MGLADLSSLTIGVFVGNYEEAYPHELRMGLCIAAREANARLIFFVGKSLQSPEEFRQNVIYHLASTERLDGLIIAAGGLGDFCRPQFLEEFCRSFAMLPTISLAFKTAGIPSVVADNREGMRRLMLHLVRDHGYRRIAFIQGPEVSFEAEERFLAYQEVLREHGIPERQDLILPGNFSFYSGGQAVRNLLDRMNLADLDAIVGCNDASTYGAFQELERRGYKVPGDIALAGFDDAEDREFASTPLTTVSQNLQEQGRRSLHILLDLIHGNPVADVTHVASELIIRESCGCSPGVGLFVGVEPVDGEKQDEVPLGWLLPETTGSDDKVKNMLIKLRESFDQDINADGLTENFLQVLTCALSELARGSKEFEFLQRIFWALCQRLRLRYPEGPPYALFENLQKAQILIASAIRRRHVLRGNAGEELLDCMRRINSKTNNAFTSIDQLMEYIICEMSALGLYNCFVSLYQSEVRGNNKEGWTIPEKSRLCLAYRDGAPVRLGNEIIFPTRLLVPDELMPGDPQYPLIVKALVSREKQFGFMVFEARESHPLMYDMLREQIGNSIYTILLYQELQDQSIKDDLTGLYNRRGVFFVGEPYYQRAVQEGACFSVLYIDLDDLKLINDKYGHKEGDYAIQTTSKLLGEMFGKDDIIARLGGDEFVVLSTDASVTDAQSIMGKFANVQQKMDQSIVEKPYQFSISVGISRSYPGKTQSLDDLLDEADRNLYKKKREKHGINRRYWRDNPRIRR